MQAVDRLPDKEHQAVVSWQKRHFKDYDFMIENWSRFYKQEPFQLVAKLGLLRSDTIDYGRLKGNKKFTRAAEMDEEMIVKTGSIIRAQASTELGSIQQHRESLHKAQDPKQQFDILRVMAEELRHAYQMIYILRMDDWGPKGQDLAEQTIQDLLGMETGSHVLDAFNLYFDSFVDNVTFCAIIDRVGKYQLSMQQVFAYAPMARSMGPMLSEEAFHLASGTNPMKQWAREAALGTGHVSIDALQRHVNKWYPRGMEMFGDERGGKSNIELSFKDMTNAEASEKYTQEMKQSVVDACNLEVLKARGVTLPPEQAVALADEVVRTHTAKNGVKPEELLYLPDVKFFRRRGLYEFQMNDVWGKPMATADEYLNYIRRVLPEPYVTGPDFRTYTENLKRHLQGEKVEEKGLPFYG